MSHVLPRSVASTILTCSVGSEPEEELGWTTADHKALVGLGIKITLQRSFSHPDLGWDKTCVLFLEVLQGLEHHVLPPKAHFTSRKSTLIFNSAPPCWCADQSTQSTFLGGLGATCLVLLNWEMLPQDLRH